MKTTFSWSIVAAGLVGISLAASQAQAGDFWKIFVPVSEPVKAAHREKPDTDRDQCVEQLANQIDWLEHYIDEFGTIVAKQPDVWGESRLTKHRQEYEQQMAAQLGNFSVTYQASLARSDASYLGFALALSSAASGTTAPAASDVVGNTNVLLGGTTTTDANGNTTSATPATVVQATTPFSLNQKTNMANLGFNPATLSLEPTMMLNELSNYLNHLHELRRINEGSDTNDSPGYALDLVRVPISVLPGKKTRKGYGAEITITATPYLSPELLPATFRDLISNDLVDLLAPALTQWVNDPEVRDAAKNVLFAEQQAANNCPLPGTLSPAGVSPCAPTPAAAPTPAPQFDYNPNLSPPSPAINTPSTTSSSGNQPSPIVVGAKRVLLTKIQQRAFATAHTPGTKTRRAYLPIPPSQIIDVFGEHMVARMIYETYCGLTRNPVDRELFQYMDVRGFLAEEVHAAYLFLGTDISPDGVPQVAPLPGGAPSKMLWDQHCGPQLAQAIRERRMRDVFNMRNNYLVTIGGDPNSRPYCLCREDPNEPRQPKAAGSLSDVPPLDPRACYGFPVCKTLTAALGWGLLVESALLNEQLNEDFREVLVAKGCNCGCPPGAWFAFYGPNPPPEARQAFMDYVRCRWPIRIFALDPVVDQQNIEDAYSRRRELQIALAMGFASGQINAQGMLRFSRQLEWDMATVALNQTAIGFSHGDDTFGWRFYPRFQTPPIKGNLSALWESVAGGPTTDQDIRDRQLEPMQRECVAIVVMPSFVPYVTFESRTRFFRLTDPKCTEVSMRQTMLLSRSIKAMQQSAAQCSQCACLYRDGDVGRLLNRVHQLDQTLPLQSMQVQLPFENTSGGFELFNRGVTDLAPKGFIGWYGALGIDPNGGTTLFLVGKAFSVNGTQVITGGRRAQYHLLSRQVMEVQVPPGVEIVSDQAANEFVDVHVATCYGVTDHLLIPLATKGSLTSAGQSDLVLQANQHLLFTYTAVPPAAGTTAPTTYTVAANPIGPANLPYLAINTPLLSAVSAISSGTFYIKADSGAYVNQVPMPATASFTLDPMGRRWIMVGTSLSALQASIAAPISAYMNALYPNGQPSGTLVFTVYFQISGPSSPTVPVGGSVEIDVAPAAP